MSQLKVRVLEVDQWTSTGNVEGTKLADWESNQKDMLNSRMGGDSEAARTIFGGSARVIEVREDAEPWLGNVWFREDEQGLLFRWKFNYDSGD